MNATTTLPNLAARCLPLLALCTAPAHATTFFSAVVDGTSQIVEVLDPSVPLVRVRTQASGTGTPGSLAYASTDVLNLANGQGTGTNRFVFAATGDELFGRFTVQLIPGADASLFDLVGQMSFTGGTGAWAGATGTGSFTAQGQFFSDTQARTRFQFEGNVSSVPEPGTWLMMATGLAVCGWRARRR